MADPTATVGDYKFEKLPDGSIVKLETKSSLPDDAAKAKEIAKLETAIAALNTIKSQVAILTLEQRFMTQRMILSTAMKGGGKVWGAALDAEIAIIQKECDLLKAVK